MTDPRLPIGPELGLEAVGAPFRVLVIEASAYSAGLLRETATPAGLSVDVERDPWEAIDRLGEDVYNVVVIDLPNPQVTGAELYERIVQLRFSDLRLPWCAGRIPLDGGPIGLHWWKEEGKIYYRVEVPAGYTVRVENLSGKKIVLRP